jgi:hypothetical protein
VPNILDAIVFDVAEQRLVTHKDAVNVEQEGLVHLQEDACFV